MPCQPIETYIKRVTTTVALLAKFLNKPHVSSKLAEILRKSRFSLANVGCNLAPERIVVAIYAFSIVCPLLAYFGAFAVGPFSFEAFQFFLLPLSITYFFPFFVISLLNIDRPSPNPAPPMPEPLGFFLYLGVIALLLFYPIVSYFLWNRYRVAWILSFVASGSTIGLETYTASTTADTLIAFWIFGVSANLLILYLLWRSKDTFFNRAVDT